MKTHITVYKVQNFIYLYFDVILAIPCTISNLKLVLRFKNLFLNKKV